MARVLILGGGCRGRQLAMRLTGEGGHAVRMVTRTEAGRAAIEAAGAECVVGDPGRLGTLRSTLDGVTIACWLLATAGGGPEEVGALHGPRLRAFLGQAIDTTMRGFVYEAPPANLATAAGERIVADLAAHNAIPVAFVRADPDAVAVWLTGALAAIDGLLELGVEGSVRYPERQSP
jgi:hypothetical protein